MKKILLAITMLLTFAIQGQEAIKLRVQYNEGDSYLMKVVTSQDMGAIMANSFTVQMIMDIVGKEGENFLTESKFKNVSMEMVQGGKTINYNSDTPEDQLDDVGKMMKLQMDPMMKALVKATISPRGESSNLTVVPANAMQAGDFANQNGVVYPEKAVKVGDSWDSSREANNVTLNTTHTVSEITSDTVKLEVTGKASGMATGTISGYVNINRANGIPRESKVVVKMDVMGQSVLTEAIVTIEKM